ncbi:hypothetical protein FXO38_15517 [Capsicum annuum]|uniref:Ubiquitin-like domain-containing protein n=2 Tax=Capsicum annuum TaxID=4072 RepID=A0A2G2Z0Q8_CAPAN|nr:hypothetical protein FXO38_15517 [Capsicum annuum]KAF3655588.1 hypothetical protein FXO37_15880 [Capsicum annuum]PHT75455.1 hypothetical protein T459_18977 [Capsicum annuum]
MAQNAESIDMTIDINVKTMDSQTHHISTSNQRRVQNLKEDIARLIGIPMEQQRLIYCGKVLKDDQVLAIARVLKESHPEISAAIETLSQYLNNMRQEYNVNGIENNMNEVLESASNPSAPSQGNPVGEQLARLLSSTRDMLINQTSRFFLELEGDLRQNLNLDDPHVRHRTESNAHRNRSLLDNLSAYFHELGRVMMQVQVGENGDEGSRLLPTAPRETLNVEDMTSNFRTLASRHPREQARADISQRINSELTNENGQPAPSYTIRGIIFTSYPMIPTMPSSDQREARVPRPNNEELTQEVTEMLRDILFNGGLQVGEDATDEEIEDSAEGSSSGPTSDHESADESDNEDVRTTESPSPATQ